MVLGDNELLLKNICAKLRYGLKANVAFLTKNLTCSITGVNFYERNETANSIEIRKPCGETTHIRHCNIGIIKPYLRPMSSMTEEEILELYKITYDTWYSDSLYYKNEEWINFRDSIKNNSLCFKTCIWLSDINKVIDWLNAHHFDYRGLIMKGLALEAPEDMYKN